MYKKSDVVRVTNVDHAPTDEENYLEVIGVPGESYPGNLSGGGWKYPDYSADGDKLYDAVHDCDQEYLLQTRNGKCRVVIAELFEYHPDHVREMMLKMKEEVGV